MAFTANQTIEARRQTVVAAFPNGAPVTVTKAQIDTATAAVVSWLEANAASYNSAIAGTVLAGATTAIKSQILALCAEIRYGGLVP